MKFSISVVIPNYKGKKLLEANLPAIYLALKSSGISDYEIIIPDDASGDDSCAYIKQYYPDIILIENQVNKGFGGNTNTGIFRAVKDLVFIVNSDVVLTENYFIPLLPYFENPLTFGVMSRIIGINTYAIQDGAKYPNYAFANIGSCKNYTSETSNSLYSLFLSGANALVDRKKIIELQGFNEIFNPYYSEDVDLGLRAWKLGYQCFYEHKAICRHPNSETIKKEPGKKVRIVSKRNKMFLHYLHLDGVELAYYLLILSLKTFFRTLILDTNYLHSYLQFLSNLKACKQAKNTFKSLQKKKNIELSMADIVKEIKREIGTQNIIKF